MLFLANFNAKKQKFLASIQKSEKAAYEKSCNELAVIYCKYCNIYGFNFDDNMELVKYYHEYIKRIVNVKLRYNMLDDLSYSFLTGKLPNERDELIEWLNNLKLQFGHNEIKILDISINNNNTNIVSAFDVLNKEYYFESTKIISKLLNNIRYYEGQEELSLSNFYNSIRSIDNPELKEWISNIGLDNTPYTIQKLSNDDTIDANTKCVYLNQILFENFYSELMKEGNIDGPFLYYFKVMDETDKIPEIDNIVQYAMDFVKDLATDEIRILHNILKISESESDIKENINKLPEGKKKDKINNAMPKFFEFIKQIEKLGRSSTTEPMVIEPEISEPEITQPNSTLSSDEPMIVESENNELLKRQYDSESEETNENLKKKPKLN